MADNNTLPEPILRTEKYFNAIANNTAGGGAEPAIIKKSKTITANGTYSALNEDFDGYEQVVANVPNTYVAADEGKVVDNGALVGQTSTNILSNGTVDTTLNNEVVVDVPNTYTTGDEGKVVDNGALVSQTAYPSTVTVNDTYDTTNYNSITVNVTSGGGSVEEKDVNFYDYDGTLLYSYTTQEFLALTEMPANPDRTSEGLTAQGWNWSFADAVDYVTDYGVLEVGQMYVTTDGKTRITILINSSNYTIYLNFGSNVTGIIDWGDGSEKEAYSRYKSHTYAKPNFYTLTMEVTSGQCIFSGSTSGHSLSSESFQARANCILSSNSVSLNNSIPYIIYDIKLGNNVILNEFAFSATRITNVNMPNNVQEGRTSGWFFNCPFLKIAIIPTSITSIGAFFIGNNSQSTCMYAKLSLPNTITSMNPGNSSSQNFLIKYNENFSLTIPKSVTSLASTFGGYGITLKNFSIPANISLYDTSNNSTNTVSLTGTGVSYICTDSNQYVFYCNNTKIEELPTNIPSTVTTMPSVQNCSALKSLIIPSQITDLANNMVRYDYALDYIKFEGTTPPTATSSTFSTLLASCKIYVPSGSLTAYTTASNYPDPNTYTYIEY